MARWAIGDVQGCAAELDELLRRLRFRADRDELWFVGDLVNRGPDSLGALRRVHALRDNVRVVLGNHDLHLLALAFVPTQRARHRDTLEQILAAPDRTPLLRWLLSCPLAWHDAARGDLMVHAGLLPQWSAARAVALGAEVSAALQSNPRRVLESMYGDQPDRWRESLAGMPRLRCIINVLTRMRFCTRAGQIDLVHKNAEAPAPWVPWFRAPSTQRAGVRVICGHWSTRGYYAERGVVGLDTGCVWGGQLSALNLDAPLATPLQVHSRQPPISEA